MSRSHAADDFATIRARMEQLRRERGEAGIPGCRNRQAEDRHEAAALDRGLGRIEPRYKDRAEGAPPPWAPTIFLVRR